MRLEITSGFAFDESWVGPRQNHQNQTLSTEDNGSGAKSGAADWTYDGFIHRLTKLEYRPLHNPLPGERTMLQCRKAYP
ncbi:MAG TPA: hypothetical protein DGA22_11925 [Acidobacterium sp.]|nr:hypothetical protein [Acidobacterium sp.]